MMQSAMTMMPHAMQVPAFHADNTGDQFQSRAHERNDNGNRKQSAGSTHGRQHADARKCDDCQNQRDRTEDDHQNTRHL